MYSVQSPPPAGSASVASVSTDVIPAGYTAIYTADDLNNVRNKLDGKYILMNDIDLSSVDNWDPIGTSAAKFTGTFDGNGHVIKNLCIDKTNQNYVGLFGNASNATIKNLGLENVDIKGKDYTAGLIGNSASSIITNCYTTGNITGRSYVSGIIGSTNGGEIAKCYTSGNSTGTEFVGGIIGYAYNSKTSNSYATGIVSGKNYIGGLAGYYGGTMTNCYTNGNTSGNTNSGLISGALIANSTLTNVWADKKDSALNAIGNGATSSTLNNSNIAEHSVFTTHEFWDKQNLDSDVWEMSVSIPPVLKGVGEQKINWYFKRGDNETRLQVGEGSDESTNALFVNSGLDLAGINIDLSTVEGCLDAVNCVKAALDAVTQKTADIGIAQSRLETISDVNTTKIENLTAAYSTVTEADVAEEVANFTKSQILAQTATSLITQTQNFHANMVLRMISSLG